MMEKLTMMMIAMILSAIGTFLFVFTMIAASIYSGESYGSFIVFSLLSFVGVLMGYIKNNIGFISLGLAFNGVAIIFHLLFFGMPVSVLFAGYCLIIVILLYQSVKVINEYEKQQKEVEQLEEVECVEN